MEWENTGLQGMVKLGSPSYVRRSVGSESVRQVPSKFWYGPQPQGIDTQVVVAQADQHTSFTSDGALTMPTDNVLAKAGWSQSPKENLVIFLTEYQGILRNRQSLQTVEASFRATSRDGLMFYDLQIAAPPDYTFFGADQVRDKAFIWVSISPPRLHSTIFKHSGPVPLRAFAPPVGFDPLPAILNDKESIGSFSARLSLSDRPQANEARLLFLGPDAKTVLASMPLGLGQ